MVWLDELGREPAVRELVLDGEHRAMSLDGGDAQTGQRYIYETELWVGEHSYHFEFNDGSEKRRAFTYKWRLWQVPEIREIAIEAGFKECRVFWEGTDKDSGEGNGVFKASMKGDNAPAFVSYLLCMK